MQHEGGGQCYLFQREVKIKLIDYINGRRVSTAACQ